VGLSHCDSIGYGILSSQSGRIEILKSSHGDLRKVIEFNNWVGKKAVRIIAASWIKNPFSVISPVSVENTHGGRNLTPALGRQWITPFC
jgi:hypothetical protein